MLKRKADVTYNLHNNSIESVENLSLSSGFEYSAAIDYLDFYDRLFPDADDSTLEDLDKEYTLRKLLFSYCHSKIITTKVGGYVQIAWNELVMMPWIIQQNIEWLHLPDETPPAENLFPVSFMEKTYKISLAPGSFYIFALVCLTTICWCIFRLYPALFVPRPIVSSFPEVDLLSKLNCDGSFEIFSRLGIGATSRVVEEKMSEVVLRFLKRQDTLSEDWELQDI